MAAQHEAATFLGDLVQTMRNIENPIQIYSALPYEEVISEWVHVAPPESTDTLQGRIPIFRAKSQSVLK